MTLISWVQSTKVAYMVPYSVAPYFQSKPSNAIESCTKYVVCFDEALNKVIHRGQMNIVVRFWDNDLKQVSSRYLTSVFLGHSRATDLLTFHEGLVSLPAANLLQVSLDRPTANWKFLETLKDSHHQHKQDCQLLELGSCGLHAIYRPLQSGHLLLVGMLTWYYEQCTTSSKIVLLDIQITVISLEVLSFRRSSVRCVGLRTHLSPNEPWKFLMM